MLGPTVRANQTAISDSCVYFKVCSPYMTIYYSSPLQLAWLTAFVHSNRPPPPPTLPLSSFLASTLKQAACTFIFFGSAHLLQLFQSVREKHNTMGEKQRRYLSMQITTRCCPFLPNFFFSPFFFSYSIFFPFLSSSLLIFLLERVRRNTDSSFPNRKSL